MFPFLGTGIERLGQGLKINPFRFCWTRSPLGLHHGPEERPVGWMILVLQIQEPTSQELPYSHPMLRKVQSVPMTSMCGIILCQPLV